MKAKVSKQEQWFVDRIGKRVYRGRTTCKCKSCLTITHEGLIIFDKQHALYLSDVSNELGVKYFDEPVKQTEI